ncbi:MULTISPECIES: hypothetical protein [Actinosynnema]|uniref:hypothetical protein n=1 Tax=Actinosynnema TaxID=40566 RepID=UPI0020A28BEB|nr:hypothetical protein [Actinosynnema pretiosum]MCP2096785.1 hypothetical protein [Actinosynnema pretiosum]
MNVRKDFFDHAIGSGEPPVELDFEAIEQRGANALRRRKRVVPALAMAGVVAVAGGVMALAAGVGSTGGLVEQGSGGGGGEQLSSTPAPSSSASSHPISQAEPTPASSTPRSTPPRSAQLLPPSTSIALPEAQPSGDWTQLSLVTPVDGKALICFSRASMADYDLYLGSEKRDAYVVMTVPPVAGAERSAGADHFTAALESCRKSWTQNTYGWRAASEPVPELVACVIVRPQNGAHGAVGVYPGDDRTCRGLGFPTAAIRK